MASHQYSTSASERQHDVDLPLQAIHAVQSQQRRQQQLVSAELRERTSQIANGDDIVTPTPPAVRVAVRERLVQSESRVAHGKRYED